jgi:hypothetical protein
MANIVTNAIPDEVRQDYVDTKNSKDNTYESYLTTVIADAIVSPILIFLGIWLFLATLNMRGATNFQITAMMPGEIYYNKPGRTLYLFALLMIFGTSIGLSVHAKALHDKFKGYKAHILALEKQYPTIN